MSKDALLLRNVGPDVGRRVVSMSDTRGTPQQWSEVVWWTTSYQQALSRERARCIRRSSHICMQLLQLLIVEFGGTARSRPILSNSFRGSYQIYTSPARVPRSASFINPSFDIQGQWALQAIFFFPAFFTFGHLDRVDCAQL